MDHDDHVRLIREGVIGDGPIWADLGSGAGAFTLALADLLGREGTIYSVDRDAVALRQQADTMHRRFPEVSLLQLVADFTRPLDLPTLDGVVMANSLHFERNKVAVVSRISLYLREGGRFVLVEYDADQANPWVPYPLSFKSWRSVAGTAGLRDTRHIASVPSRFLGSIYAALSIRGN